MDRPRPAIASGRCRPSMASSACSSPSRLPRATCGRSRTWRVCTRRRTLSPEGEPHACDFLPRLGKRQHPGPADHVVRQRRGEPPGPIAEEEVHRRVVHGEVGLQVDGSFPRRLCHTVRVARGSWLRATAALSSFDVVSTTLFKRFAALRRRVLRCKKSVMQWHLRWDWCCWLCWLLSVARRRPLAPHSRPRTANTPHGRRGRRPLVLRARPAPSRAVCG